MATKMITAAVGLLRSNNQLANPDGALNRAENVIIRRDGVLESRRGFKVYGSELPSIFDRVKQLKNYRSRLLRHYSDKLAFDNGSGVFTDFAGNYSETETGLRIKTVESNGNFYFTTSEGIKKLSVKTPSQFPTAKITNAGGIQALDLEAEVEYNYGAQTGFLPEDSCVAYRVVWATRDANNNLILGAPSQRTTVYNPMLQIMLQDLDRMLLALDNITDSITTARISDGNYVTLLRLPISASAYELRSNLISLSAKLDTDILYAQYNNSSPLKIVSAVITGGICTINFDISTFEQVNTYLEPGSLVELVGFSPATGTINGAQTVVSVGTNFFSFNTAATGTVTLSSSKIYSNKYRSITQPGIPSVPTTNDELVALQQYMDQIITRLQLEPPTATLPGIVITEANKISYIDNLDTTKTSTVKLWFAVPQAITEDYFYQIYRSSINQATGVAVLQDLFPSDELQLIYEAYPTTAEITAKEVVLVDITPDEFRGANLYTNASTGEGITQANNPPPFAKDITRFKNVTFYANTKTKHQMLLSLIGVQNMIDFLNASPTNTCTLNISSTAGSQTYSFVLGKIEKTHITCTADVNNNLNETYFDLYAANDLRSYRFYYKTSAGTDIPPAADGHTLVRINIPTNGTAAQIAEKTMNLISVYCEDFNASITTTPTIDVECTAEGYTTDFNPQTTRFTYTIEQGQGERASTNEVLLSTQLSVGLAVESTAKSLVRVVNKNGSENLYGFYISGASDVPGKMYFESKFLDDIVFSMIANNSQTGSSFNPDLTTASSSENEQKANRVYYSKYLQAEAVPIVNYFDVGAEDKSIKRIFPLRDSLFVFKEDGLFRISGETSPFNVALFDSSCIIIAPDSVNVVNNLVYGWTTQGISITSESNTQIISRPVDVDILLLASSNYPNFKTATWGLGYESDSSYTVYSVSKTSDSVATRGWRYSNLTGSWTTVEKSATAGCINIVDDKMYLGAGDIPYLEQERKSFTRTDYADREYEYIVAANIYINNKIRFANIDNFSLGDVLVQEQTVTLYEFNMLLKKLDTDLGLQDKTYYITLNITKGHNLRDQITLLAIKLDADLGYSGVSSFTNLISGFGQDFAGIKSAYNTIVAKFNVDPTVVFSNYLPATNGSTLESSIITINQFTKEVTLSDTLDFYIGAITLFKAIPCVIEYSPITLGDPSGLKHLRESQFMFENKAFTGGAISFSTDLLPQYETINFLAYGNGVFGANLFGGKFFGGSSHSAPIRTYIPRNCQRCTFINILFAHNTAREKWSLFGVSVTGEVGTSTRAYR